MNKTRLKQLVQAVLIAAMLLGAHLIVERHEAAMAGKPMGHGHGQAMGH